MEETLQSGGTAQDIEGVRQFFDQWHLYKKVVGLDYLNHRGTFAAIGKALDGFAAPFSFLDLGAGDAEWTTRVLASRRLASYEAVDISSVALGLAEKNAEALACEKRFTQADFFSFVQNTTTPRDVVFIGLSLHHLLLEDKKRFFASVRRFLAPGGHLIFNEPVKCPKEETRDGYLDRFWKYTQRDWTELNAEELQQVHDHVFGNDYPESIEDYTEMARENGFSTTELLYQDPDKLYAVLHCR